MLFHAENAGGMTLKWGQAYFAQGLRLEETLVGSFLSILILIVTYFRKYIAVVLMTQFKRKLLQFCQ